VASWYSHPLYVSSIVPGQLAYLGTVSISPQYVRYGATGIELTATAKYNTPLGLVFNWRNERDFWVAMAYNVNSPDSGAAAILRVYHMKNEQSSSISLPPAHHCRCLLQFKSPSRQAAC